MRINESSVQLVTNCEIDFNQESYLQVAVLEVSEPERLRALVERERRLDAVDERLQTLLERRHLTGQSDVLGNLRVRAQVLQHARRRLQTLEQTDDVIAVEHEHVIDDRHRLTHERLDEDATALQEVRHENTLTRCLTPSNSEIFMLLN